MRETVRQPPTPPPRRRFRTLALYCLLSAAFVSALVLSIGRVHWTVLAAATFAYPALLGWLLVFRPLRKSLGSDAHWRDVMPCYLTVLDRDFRIIDSNSQFRRDFGDRTGELCYEVFKRAEAPCPECVARDVFADGKVRTHKSTVVKATGEVADIISTTSPQYDKRGEIVAAVEMFTDVTELEALRRKLEKTRQNYQRLFDTLPCHASVLDRDFKLIEANHRYRSDFGAVLGGRCYEVCKDLEKPCPDCLVSKTFETGEIYASEETLTTRDGRTLNMVVHSMPVPHDSGEIRHVMEVFTDITEIKRLESKLAMMGRAVAGIAHRIKNILMGLEGGIFVVNTAMEDGDQDLVGEGWQMVESNVAKVSHIMKDLLYTSKERKPGKKVEIDPREVLSDVRELYRERLAAEGIALRVEVQDTVRPGVFDPDGLHNLLLNLVSNAIDACRFDERPDRPDHEIVLACRQNAAGETILSVSDNGPGIPDEYSGRVFQDFFSTKGTEGTGIGLLVVQRVAEEHGGTVTFETKAGRGTKFSVILPTG